jgi:cysteine-rich repeat protein
MSGGSSAICRAGLGAVVVVALVLATSWPVRAWQRSVEGSGGGNGEANVAVAASDGDVIVAGYVDQAGTGPAFTVVRLAAADGTERWRTVLAGTTGVSSYGPSTRGGVRALAIDASGGVVAVGSSSLPAGGPALFTAVKLVAATGAIQWRFDGLGGEANAVAADSAGGVFVAGRSNIYGEVDYFTVVKLEGTTGAPLWTAQHPNVGAFAIAMLPSGDVVVEGNEIDFNRFPHPLVVRFDGSNGSGQWATSPVGGSSISGVHGPVAVTSGGDVLVTNGLCPDGGCLPNFVDVFLVAGGSGNVVWHRSVPPGPPLSSSSLQGAVRTLDDNLAITVIDDALCDVAGSCKEFRTLLIDHDDGAVLAEREDGGYLAIAASGDLFVAGHEGAAARLAPSDLHEIWRREADRVHAATAFFLAHGAVVAGSRLVVPGYRWTGGRRVFSVLSLDAGNGTLDACGDGVLDAGEQCDDGNLVDGDCCTACATNAADATSCDDGDACTIGETCTGGSCRSTEPLPCEPCGSCQPDYGCRANPAPVCARSTASDTATLVVKRGRGGRVVRWSMRSGPETRRADLGDPTGAGGYALCAYSNGEMLVRATAPSGACRGARTCWHRTPRGFAYDDPKATDGLSRLSLRAGPAGRSRFRVAGHGPRLSLGDLPVGEGAVTVQLRRLDDPNVCWAADHTTIVVNRSRALRAVGD